MNTINRIIYCIIDSVRADQFFQLINKGFLPNFKKLYDEGIYSKNCITDFPAVTYPSQVSMITGTYTGDFNNELCHGVPLYNWMDRSVDPPLLRSYGTYGSDERIQIYKMNEDIGRKCQTILEMIDEGNKASILQFINRGANYFYPENKIKLAFYYLLLKNSNSIEKHLYRLNTVVTMKILNLFEKPHKFFNIDEVPIASLLWFASPDILLHLYGSQSKQYILNLMHVDKNVGIMLNKLDTLGYLDDTAIAIISDHGNYPVKEFGNLSSFVQKYRLQNYHPRKNRKAIINITDFGSIGFINVKPKDCYSETYWNPPKLYDIENFGLDKINLLSELFKIKGCELLYYRGDENRSDKGVVHLKRKMENSDEFISASIEYQGFGKDLRIKYKNENQNHDIFDFNIDESSAKMLDNRFHTLKEWLEGTYHVDYPIYPELLIRHFKNPRGGDIIISTKGSIVYNITHGVEKKPNRFVHDIGLRRCSIVPLLIGGSKEIPHKEIKYCRIVDLVPTLLKMIKKNPHESVMGESLV
jgi:hypothetical protein